MARVSDNPGHVDATSEADVQRFFCGVYAKALAGQPLETMETLVHQWIEEHPEYHGGLADADALRVNTQERKAGPIPFLHLSMHLSINKTMLD